MFNVYHALKGYRNPISFFTFEEAARFIEFVNNLGSDAIMRYENI